MDWEQVDNHYVICPHCGHKHGDTWEFFGDREDTEITCHECERDFFASRIISETFITCRKVEAPALVEAE
jgi:transposase